MPKSDQFIKPESWRYNVSILIYHYEDFKRWHQVLKEYRWMFDKIHELMEEIHKQRKNIQRSLFTYFLHYFPYFIKHPSLFLQHLMSSFKVLNVTASTFLLNKFITFGQFSLSIFLHTVGFSVPFIYHRKSADMFLSPVFEKLQHPKKNVKGFF